MTAADPSTKVHAPRIAALHRILFIMKRINAIHWKHAVHGTFTIHMPKSSDQVVIEAGEELSSNKPVIVR